MFIVSLVLLRVQMAQEPLDVRLQVRKEISERYEVWGKARLAYDRGQLDELLAPDF